MATNASSGNTAFVLAGGGSLGAIQVGMLRELVTHGVPPHIVVGSSVEALNGAYFAADRTAAGVTRLEAIWRGLRRQDIFPVTLRRVAGLFFGSAALVDSRGLRRVIEQHLPYRELEHAAIPMHIAATELLSGASVELSSGSAVEAILASCAIPAAFAPVRLGNDYLIDGAIASNTPIMTAVKLGDEPARRAPHGIRVLTESTSCDGDCQRAAFAQSPDRPPTRGYDRVSATSERVHGIAIGADSRGHGLAWLGSGTIDHLAVPRRDAALPPSSENHLPTGSRRRAEVARAGWKACCRRCSWRCFRDELHN